MHGLQDDKWHSHTRLNMQHCVYRCKSDIEHHHQLNETKLLGLKALVSKRSMGTQEIPMTTSVLKNGL